MGFKSNNNRKLYYAFWILSAILILLRMSRSCNEDSRFSETKTVMNAISLDSLISSLERDTSHSVSYSQTVTTYFYFDPNTLDSVGFVRLGIDSKIVSTILKYRSKGRFKDADAFFRIYGLDNDKYDPLREYVKVSSSDCEKSVIQKRTFSEDNLLIELNSCTKSDLCKIRGIGEKLSERIINYRSYLGGYVFPDQLLEVYGLSDSLVYANLSHFRTDTSLVVKIKINTVEPSDIKHPYIKGEWKKSIKVARNGGKVFSSWDELLSLGGYTDSLCRKARPYIDFSK